MSVRVRFAPSPTGIMHLGNVRAALINYLFARQKNGQFILRIEDTDPQRNMDRGGEHILNDLRWLGLTHDEGPDIGGPYGPYLQSERTSLYQEQLQRLQEAGAAYRCFCSAEELELRRQRQIALKMPPRYDRACAALTPETVSGYLADKKPFIWRFRLPDGSLEVKDFARGTLKFDLKHFSDCPLTRQDGSFTFVFANFVDDVTMHISHIFRGEEHISNTALQAALYESFALPIPMFWHFPIICNVQGKKLSKRDFGFTLHDLRDAGYFPEAIVNYLAIIGGSFQQEIMSLSELIAAVDFEKNASAGFIRYDVEKLRWINNRWMNLLPLTTIAERCMPLLLASYPQAAVEMTTESVAQMLQPLRNELITLEDCVQALKFVFESPLIELENVPLNALSALKELDHQLQQLPDTRIIPADELSALFLHVAKQCTVSNKEMFHLIRIALTGRPEGIGIKDLLKMLSYAKVRERIHELHTLLKTARAE